MHSAREAPDKCAVCFLTLCLRSAPVRTRSGSLPQIAQVSSDVVLVAGDKMHDGYTPERVERLVKAVKAFDNATLVIYHSAGGKHSIAPGGYRSPTRRFWNKWARWSGVHYVRERDRCVLVCVLVCV